MIDHVDWKSVGADLDELGVASTGPVLTPAQCRALADLYDDDGRFRSTIDMARHRFGEGLAAITVSVGSGGVGSASVGWGLPFRFALG
jgi:hypothetical protein